MKIGKSGYALLGLLVSVTCAAGNQNDGALLLSRAAQCLAAKSFLPRSKATTLSFGYFLDTNSWPSQRVLYIVNYPNASQRGGFVYTLFLGERDGKQVFNIQNNASFVLSKRGYDGVSFVDPPLWGIWRQQHLAMAIRKIERQPRTTLSVHELSRVEFSFMCQAYTDQ